MESPPSGDIVIFERGKKFFELSNHLGNVLVSLSDRKIQTSSGGVLVDYYSADIVSATDSYVFGMTMPGRNFQTDKYRYGFNGKEKDKDASQDNLDFDARIYDSRLGRWLSVDPLQHVVPGISPYVFCYDNPTNYIDPDGKYAIEVTLRKGKDGKFTIIAITISDDLKLSINSYYKNHSIIYERQWRDYIHITTEDATGAITGTETVLGEVRYTTNNFWEHFDNIFGGEKKWVKNHVDDGYAEDRDGIMFYSESGAGGSHRKTKNAVYMENLDGLAAALGGGSKLDNLKLPTRAMEIVTEAMEKWRVFEENFGKNPSTGNKHSETTSNNSLMKILEDIIEKKNTPAASENKKPNAPDNSTPRIEPGKSNNNDPTYCRTCKKTYEKVRGKVTFNPTDKKAKDTIDVHKD